MTLLPECQSTAQTIPDNAARLPSRYTVNHENISLMLLTPGDEITSANDRRGADLRFAETEYEEEWQSVEEVSYRRTEGRP